MGDSDQDFCRQLSVQMNEPLAGTAAHARSWIVLQYEEAWADKAYARAELPGPVRAAVDGWVAALPEPRVQLIRRDGVVGQGVTLYVGDSSVRSPGQRGGWLRRFSVPAYDALANLDIPAVFAAMNGEGPRPGLDCGEQAPPMVLVCTNGKRDRCCAKWGLPLYQALATRDDVVSWQTTHLGGHRFAATALVLPSGLCYGRLEPGDLAGLAASAATGTVFRLDRLRGRTCYAPAVQAAEVALREDTADLEAPWPVVDLPMEESGLKARFEGPGGERRDVTVRISATGMRPGSCGEGPKSAPRFVCSVD